MCQKHQYINTAEGVKLDRAHEDMDLYLSITFFQKVGKYSQKFLLTCYTHKSSLARQGDMWNLEDGKYLIYRETNMEFRRRQIYHLQRDKWAKGQYSERQVWNLKDT